MKQHIVQIARRKFEAEEQSALQEWFCVFFLIKYRKKIFFPQTKCTLNLQQ